MKNLFYWMAVLLLFVACQKDDEPSIDKTDPDTNEEYRVSEKEAVSRAVKAIESIEEETSSRANIERRLKQVQRVRNSALTRNAEEIEELFYLVNFADEQGYALVAADERMTDVYMMAEKGNLDLEEVDPQSGLAFFLDRAVVYAHGELIPNDSLLIPPIDDDGDDEMVDRDDSISCLLPEEYKGVMYHVYRQDEYFTHNANLPTQWDQGEPYNNKCPLINYSQHAAAGCAAIAMGQIMAYHRHPSFAFGHSYNWSAILEFPSVSPTNQIAADAVSTLIRDIGATIHMNYGILSGAYPQDVPGGFEQFGYTTDDMMSYNFISTAFDIRDSKPVFVAGYTADHSSGHAWAIDAVRYIALVEYYYSTETLELCFTRTNNYRNCEVRCNWGGGGGPAWTISDVFNPGESYSNDLKLIRNIRPIE